MNNVPPFRYDGVASFIEKVVDEDMIETVCSVFRTERRQLVVLFLLGLDSGEWVSVEEIARWTAGIEEGASAEAVTGQAYKRVRTALTQGHLSVLAEADVIRYKSDRQKVAKGARLETMGRYLLILLLALQSE